MESGTIGIIGIVVAVLQVIIALYLNGIRSDIKDIWARLNDHSHEIHCSGDDCRDAKLGHVVITKS